MDETLNQEEQLLAGPEAREFLPAGENYPLLSAEEFLKRTPPHELQNIFGAAVGAETSKQEIPNPEPEVRPPHLPPMVRKETLKPQASPSAGSEAKQPHPILRFVIGFLLFTLVVIIGFYIWGGILLTN